MAEDLAFENERLFREGVELFNARRWFEAHEVWEDLWRERTGHDRTFVQGLIQCSVALEHVRRGNPRGALRTFDRARPKLAHPPPRWCSEVDIFVREIETFLAPLYRLSLDRLGPRQRLSQLPMDLDEAPRLMLKNLSV